MAPEFNRGLALAANAMPLMWVIGEDDRRFHVIHAELVKSGFRQSNDPVWLDCDIDQWLQEKSIPTHVEERLYWSRALMTESERRPLSEIQLGLSATFCGHTLISLTMFYLIFVWIQVVFYLNSNILMILKILV